MRLLYLVHHWPGLFKGYLQWEIRWLRQRGHSVVIVSLGSGGAHGFRNETRDHVDLKEFGLEDIPVLYLDSKQMTAASVVGEALQFARRHGVQLIDADVAREPAEVACRMHRSAGIPYAVRMVGGDAHSNISPELNEIAHYAAAICPVSRFLADVLTGRRRLKKTPAGIPAKISPEKLHVLPLNVPAACLSQEPAAQRDDLQVIGAIGRAVPIKRFHDIIDAVAGLNADFPGLKLKIIGGGELLPELQKQAHQAGLADCFEITGFRSWREVMALTRELHIYVQASELEGCSQSTIEAAFQGVPLVLSRTGANEQCVEQGINGYLFDSGDVTALRESLRLLLMAGARARERMGKASLEIAGRQFSTEKILPEIETLFQNIIDDCGKFRCAQPADTAAR